MAYIIWRDDFNIGVKEMDAQHKLFISYINDLYIAMQSGDTDAIVGRIQDRLRDYIELHFRAEEEMLRAISYQGLANQIKQHAYYVSQIFDYRTSVRDGNQTPQDMFIFLRDWFLHHIATEDQKYVEFVQSAKT